MVAQVASGLLVHVQVLDLMQLVINAVYDPCPADLFQGRGLGDESLQYRYHIFVHVKPFVGLPQQTLDLGGHLAARPEEDLGAVEEALLHGDLYRRPRRVVDDTVDVIQVMA